MNIPFITQKIKIMLTKQLKEDWLAALKSGKYRQGKVVLREDDKKEHCCLGVLAEIHPEWSISSNGEECVIKGELKSYEPFEDLLGPSTVGILYTKNDFSYKHDKKRHFESVIPIIEQLPTID